MGLKTRSSAGRMDLQTQRSTALTLAHAQTKVVPRIELERHIGVSIDLPLSLFIICIGYGRSLSLPLSLYHIYRTP